MTMQFLQVVQKSFNSIGLSPSLEPFNHITLSIFILGLPSVGFLWMFIFYGAHSSQEYMESIYMVTICGGIFLSYGCTIFIKSELFSFIDAFNELTNERLKTPKSKQICEQTHQLVEKYTEIGLFLIRIVITPCFVLPKAIVSFFAYFTTDLGSDAFKLPAAMWVPYDWKNPFGYLLTLSGQWLWAIYLGRYVGCFIFLAFGVFMFVISYVGDLKRKLHLINDMAIDKKTRKHMYNKLFKVIHLHANAKQMFVPFSSVYEINLTILFVGCMISICVAMLLLQIEISHNEIDSIILLEAVFFGACALLQTLFVCELGQRFTNSIAEIDEMINELDWYLFPYEIQRVLPIIMLNTQKPAAIKCFGNVLCSRKQFQKVVKTVYSNFMVLRQFYE